MPLFSIIIPVYNSEQFLVEAVQSVLGQKFKSLEIILVNDCSTDKSGEICDSFCRKNEWIKVIHNKKNSGVSASRNTALKAALGEYILFVDSDDCLLNGCLSGLANLIEEKPDVDLIIGRYTSERYRLRGEGDLSQDFTFNNAAINADDPDGVITHIKDFARLAGVCWRFAINRNFLIKNNLYFIQARIYEDQEYVARLLCLAKKFAFYDKGLYWYRARPGSITESITHSMNYDNSAACLKVVVELCKLIRNNDFSDLKKEFLYTRIKTSLITFYGHLPMHDRREIYEFSQMIDSDMDSFKMLEAISNDIHPSPQSGREGEAPTALLLEEATRAPIIDMYLFVKVHGAYYGLLLLKAFATEKTISLIEGAQNKRLYIFCADLFGKATAQILKNEGYPVQCFLDNNKGLEGNAILGLKVNNPSIFADKPQDELSDIFVIICHQRKDVFESMTSQLEKIGLKRDQIAHQDIFSH